MKKIFIFSITTFFVFLLTSSFPNKIEASSGNCRWQKDLLCTGVDDKVYPDVNCMGTSGKPGDEYVCCCTAGEEDLGPTDIPNPTGLKNLGQLIEKASGVVTPLAVVGFIFSVIYAGFVRMTAAGNAEKEAKSMKIAIAAAIGFAIMALAPLLVRVLANFLNVDQDLVS
ncbi:hypothetical protein ACFLY9_02300 [Patescibacteria group bacterium]